MNKFFTLVFGLMTLFLTSCNFSEDVYINEDGSGKISFSFDGSQLMQMAGDKIKEDGEKAIDSTFSFKELFDEKRDSISKLPAEEQAKFKKLENFSMHMVMNPETEQMTFELFTEFNNASEMQNMFEAMNTFSELEGNKKGKKQPINDPSNPFSQLDNTATKLDYNFDGKTFTRTVKILDPEAHQKGADSIKDMMAMFGSSTYKLNYHFPRPVKSVNNDNAMFSADRKTIMVEFPFATYVTDPEALNLEIILED
ncbi:hypothetical protein [Mesoflavibacter zeaxanthinifaciens]|uniref:hypothetical protein n=1 Tax=Mesoflavibacter zeaxanthinifaciens TaxID=393060 RepID=UPI003A925099